MPVTDLRQTILQIINQVQIKLGVNTTSSLTATKLSTVLLRLLNETVDECADFGSWQELYEEVLVTAQSSVNSYVITPTSGNTIKNIYEVRFQGQTAAMYPVSIEDIRLLGQLNSYGVPIQYAVKGVDQSTGNPKMQTYPTPGVSQSGMTFNVALYNKPRLYTTSDINVTPVFPANVLIQGTYAKAMLEENGGEPTNQYQIAYQEYLRMRKEALNRYTSDTGAAMYIQPPPMY